MASDTTTKTGPLDELQRLEAELTVAQAAVDQNEAELNSTLRDLESAADRGDVDRVLELRRAAQVDLPARLAHARAVLIDAQVSRAEARRSLVDSELVDQSALLEEAQKAYAAAEAALEHNRALQHEKFDLGSTIQQLQRDRESIVLEAEKAMRSATRRLAGLDITEEAAQPVSTDIHIGLPEISQRDIDQFAGRT